jgi:hypothetical protein
MEKYPERRQQLLGGLQGKNQTFICVSLSEASADFVTNEGPWNQSSTNTEG